MRGSKLLVSVSLALVLAASMAVAAPGDGVITERFAKRASGVYLVTGLPPEGPPFLLVFNVHRQHLMSTSAQVQGTTLSGFAFVDDQGIWRKTGRRQITARLLSFNFMPPGTEPPAGALHSNGLADVVMDFAENFSTVSGTFTITLFAFDVNPLAPEAEPLGPPLVILFEGQRLTMH